MNAKITISIFLLFLLASLIGFSVAELMYSKVIPCTFTANKAYDLKVTWSENGSEVQNIDLGKLYASESVTLPEISIQNLKDGGYMRITVDCPPELVCGIYPVDLNDFCMLDFNSTAHRTITFLLTQVLASGDYNFNINFELHDSM